MKINNVEIEDLDLMDADIAERFEKAVENLQEREKKVNIEGMGLSQIIRNQCTLIFDFFNDIWGTGTDKKVFGDKVNYNVCVKAFKDTLQYAADFKKDLKPFKLK